MSLLHPDRARPLPVRLCDLKPEALRRAALQAAREESDPAMVDMILHAAMCPSDRVFYVSAAAREQLESLAA